MFLQNQYFPMTYRNTWYLVLYRDLYIDVHRADARTYIKSLVSFAPSCSKYQSPLDELAHVPFFQSNPDHRIDARGKKMHVPTVYSNRDGLSRRASFVSRAFPTLSSIIPDSCSRAEFWFLIVQIGRYHHFWDTLWQRLFHRLPCSFSISATNCLKMYDKYFKIIKK